MSKSVDKIPKLKYILGVFDKNVSIH